MSHVRSVSIHPAPAHLAKAEFEQKMDAQMDVYVTAPAVKKNTLKVEMLIPNSNLDMHAQALGFPAPHPTAIVIQHWESEEQMLETSSDPTVMKVVADGTPHLGFDGAGSCVFHADVVRKIDLPSDQDSVYGFITHPVPAHLSKAQFQQKADALLDAFIAVPAVKKGALKIEMFVPNSNLDNHVQEWGLPAPHPTVLFVGEWKSLEELLAVAEDQTVKSLVARAIADFGFGVGSCAGTADVVTKFTKEN
ncbi:hypothetical protein C8R44DRAFT_793144, partial [Mycena epipterygia]